MKNKNGYQNKINNIWIVLFFISGFLFIGLYIFLKIVDPKASSEVLIFLFAGMIILLCSLIMFAASSEKVILIERDFLIITGNLLSKKKLKLSKIAFVSSYENTLQIMLKNGKIRTIANIENASSISSKIKKHMVYDSKAKTSLLLKALNRSTKLKKYFKLMCLCMILMFAYIVTTLILTQGKDTEQFTKAEWAIFITAMSLEGITLFPLFYFAKKSEYMLQIKKSQNAIMQTVIRESPLLSENAIRVYASPDFIQRITIVSNTTKDGFYYIAEKFDTSFNFQKTYESETFSHIEELISIFENFKDISKNWIENK